MLKRLQKFIPFLFLLAMALTIGSQGTVYAKASDGTPNLTSAEMPESKPAAANGTFGRSSAYGAVGQIQVGGKPEPRIKRYKREVQPTEQQLDKIEKVFRGIIKLSRSRGWNVAADNLEYFLEGRGGVKTIRVDWLRSFRRVLEAERINQQRFESRPNTRNKSLTIIASKLKPGESEQFSDYWERDIRGSGELRYASGKSRLKSQGQFDLERDGNTVNITGEVTHSWSDPYDWHSDNYFGLAERALILQNYGSAESFMMEATWTQQVTCTVSNDTISCNWEPPR